MGELRATVDHPARVGALLQRLCDESGRTRPAIAARAGMVPRTLRRYLAGECMHSLGAVGAIARAAGYQLRVVVEPIGDAQ